MNRPESEHTIMRAMKWVLDPDCFLACFIAMMHRTAFSTVIAKRGIMTRIITAIFNAAKALGSVYTVDMHLALAGLKTEDDLVPREIIVPAGEKIQATATIILTLALETVVNG